MSKLEVQLANAEVAYQKQLQGNLVELNRQLSEAIMRVRELHQPTSYQFDSELTVCGHCKAQCHSETGLACDIPTDALWPCPTIKALDGES